MVLVDSYIYIFGSAVAQSLRSCVTSWIVPGSIPGSVTGFFSDIFPSNLTMTLGSTQPLVKMSIRNIPWGKSGRWVRLTTSPPSHAECHEIWEPKPPGTLWATLGLLWDPFTFTFIYIYIYIYIYILQAPVIMFGHHTSFQHFQRGLIHEILYTYHSHKLQWYRKPQIAQVLKHAILNGKSPSTSHLLTRLREGSASK